MLPTWVYDRYQFIRACAYDDGYKLCFTYILLLNIYIFIAQTDKAAPCSHSSPMVKPLEWHDKMTHGEAEKLDFQSSYTLSQLI